MKYRTLSLLLFLMGSIAGYAQEAKMGGYLMVYHKDQDHGLHMAVSYDGYNWVGLNNDKPIIGGDTIAMQKGIRDPHVFRA
ncbi:MAG: hypothetical protein Q4A08_04040, partial [Bacteroidales bacterium]|nr:hypothetical protein [Bacteroidales bacterium]